MVRKDGVSAYFHIRIIPTNLPSTQTNTTHLLLEIQTFITKFAPCFRHHSPCLLRDLPITIYTRVLRNILALAEFYRRFICGYASIAAPLTRFTTQDPFEWTPAAQHAFSELKGALTTALVWVLSDFSLSFTLETDASGIGMGVMLSQKGHHIAFFNKPFSLKCFVLPPMSKLFAITATVKKWRQYLFGSSFHHYYREGILSPSSINLLVPNCFVLPPMSVNFLFSPPQ